MKNYALLFLVPVLLAASACQKDDNDATPDPLIDICGIDGMRLQAEVDGAETCFSTTLFGSLADGQIGMGGIHPSSGSLALQLDGTTVGTHAATADANHIMLVVGGLVFQSSNEAPGSITITSHDQGANHIKGSFTAQLASPDGSPARSVEGTFDVTYLEQ